MPQMHETPIPICLPKSRNSSSQRNFCASPCPLPNASTAACAPRNSARLVLATAAPALLTALVTREFSCMRTPWYIPKLFHHTGLSPISPPVIAAFSRSSHCPVLVFCRMSVVCDGCMTPTYKSLPFTLMGRMPLVRLLAVLTAVSQKVNWNVLAVPRVAASVMPVGKICLVVVSGACSPVYLGSVCGVYD